MLFIKPMKTQLQTLVASLATAIDQLPVDPLRVFVLDMPRPDAMTVYNSSLGDLNNWNQWGPNLFPGSVYDNGINRLTWVGAEAPQGVEITKGYTDISGDPQMETFVVQWVDHGIYDPMIEATSTISRLQETEVVLREELARQTNRIAELEQHITATNAAIDAAQGQA